MPISLATKLGIQFARFAAASGNVGSAGLRGTFSNATAGSSTGASSSWAQGLSSGPASNGAGLGGAKFQAGRGAHSTFSQSGRAIVNANGSSSHDGSTSVGDDEEELSAHQAWIHRPGQLHRSSIDFRRPHSPSQRSLSSSRSRYEAMTLPALQLIVPQKSQLLITPASPQQARAHTNSAKASAPSSPSDSSALSSDTPSLMSDDGSDQSSAPSISRRRHVRSRSLSTIADTKGPSPLDIPSLLGSRQGPKYGPRREPRGTVKRSTDDSKRADGVNHRNSETRDDYDEVKMLDEAIRSPESTPKLLAARKYLEVDPSKASVGGYLKALRALYAAGIANHQDVSTIREILDVYEHMLANDIRPDLGTYDFVVKALCHRDRRLHVAIFENARDGQRLSGEDFKGTEDAYRQEADAHYSQALSIFHIVHASTPGFRFLQTYYDMLFCCQLRGDASQACEILECLARNPNLQADATIFALLIRTLLKDVQTLPGESSEQKSARLFAAIRQVFEEFEARRAAPDWTHSLRDGRVWDAMVEASFHLGHPAIAMELLEVMAGSDAQSSLKGAAPAPFPTDKTTINTLRSLIRLNDLSGAYAWVDGLVKLHSVVDQGEVTSAHTSDAADASEDNESTASEDLSYDAEQGVDFSARPAMPAPALTVLCQLINATTLHVRTDATGNVEQLDPDKMLLIESANRTLNYIFSRFENQTWKNRLPMIHSPCANVLRANSQYAYLLGRQGRNEEANRFVDSLLTLIHSYFKFDWLERTDADGKLDAKAVKRHLRIAGEVLMAFNPVFAQGRVQDAASLLTYALESSLTSAEGLRSVPAGEAENVEILRGRLLNTFHTLCGSDSVGTHTPLQRIYAIAEIAIPAYVANDYRKFLTQGTVAKIMDLYREARKEVEPSQMPLSVVGWNKIIETCMEQMEHSGRAVPSLQDPLHLLLTDLATLPESMRLQLDVNELAKVAVQQSPSTLTDVVKAINADLPALYNPFEEARKRDSPDGLTATPPPDMASLLDGLTTPPAGAGVQIWPAVQMLDEDLSHQINRGSQRKGWTPIPAQELYAKVLRSVTESGAYPSMLGICSLLTAVGRAGDMVRLRSVYSLGAHVLSGMGGNAEWQMYAWAQLERSMIAGLAHAGDAMGASEHRHRMLKAGQIPDADAYAALIAVVRDTTDDAMVAEELFDESQRLQVKPTVYLFNTVISKLCRARKIERAMQLFDELRRHNLTPSSVTYGALINGCVRTGEEQNAESLFAMMEADAHFRANAPPFNTMMQFYTYTKPNRQKALSYYQKMQKLNVAPTGHTYKVLLDVYGTVEPVDVAGMEHIFGLLIADSGVSVQGTHWSSILTAHGIQRGDLDKTVALFESIPGHIATHRAAVASKKQTEKRVTKGETETVPDAVTYEALLNVCLSHNRVDMMQHYVERMRASGIQPTAYVGNLLMRGLDAQPEQSVEQADASVADAENVPRGLAQARALFEEMDDPPMGIAAAGNHPVNHRHHANGDVLASTTAGEEQPVAAAESDGVIGESFGFKGVLREPSTFNTMIRIELNRGNRDAAQALVERMQLRGYPPALLAKAYMMLESEVPAIKAAAAEMTEETTTETTTTTPA